MNIIRRTVAAALGATLALHAVTASAAYESYIRLVGTKQGPLKGSVTKATHPGAFRMIERAPGSTTASDDWNTAG